MTIAINSNPERDQDVASFNGQVTFTYGFPIFSDAYIDVYLTPVGQVADDATAGRLLTLGVDYTVTGAGTATGGTIILTAGATIGDIITMEGVQPIERASVFQDLNPFTVALNDQLNQQTIMAQQSYTYWNEITPHYNHSELVSEIARPFKRILPMLPDGHVWVGRGDLGDPIDDITTMLFASGGSGTTASTIVKNISQAAHGLSVGDYVRIDAVGDYVVAQADSAANAELAGLVTVVINPNAFTLTMVGYIDTGVFAGLTLGGIYFLSASTPGGHTLVEPSGLLEVSLPVFYAETATTGWLRHYRGIINGGEPDIAAGTESSPVIVNVNQVGHGLVAENVVYLSAANVYTKARADVLATASAVGIVIDVIDADNFILQTNGYQSGFIVGKANATVYYLSPITAGLMTVTKPTTTGHFIKQVYISSSATDGYIQETQPEEIPVVPGVSTGWTLISTQTVGAGVPELDVTGMTGYYRYKIVLENLTPTTDASKSNIRTSSDNGVTFDSGASNYSYSAGSSTYSDPNFGTKIVLDSARSCSNVIANGGVSGFIEIINPSNIVTNKSLIFNAVSYTTSIFGFNGGAMGCDTMHGMRRSTAIIDAIRFYFDKTGVVNNIASGTIKLYGTNV